MQFVNFIHEDYSRLGALINQGRNIIDINRASSILTGKILDEISSVEALYALDEQLKCFLYHVVENAPESAYLKTVDCDICSPVANIEISDGKEFKNECFMPKIDLKFFQVPNNSDFR
jgi:hypothetical protein